ncbi:MAG TPA: phosphoenolpyruvate--protein phosphotransferase [Vitreimonas sp.]|uniref:phosphoenolpyruvate--protein phosphotransferase n=1 Tax=Vitreimonas sp. TaxID=3069702 RepID=UPI002D633AFF|nr:phosphoenolpyruvate--protein phosphotransferase [Vitreimonas sp.]HYD86748.1 phosphoenolpyruvate--protein phosphotransferase [Vitreimonas sp.]
MSTLVISSPLEGWAAPLSEVPDAVFAERMMGDGVAIDPVGAVLYAPFDGEVISLPQTGHALGVRSDAGVEMLIHVGLETVALAGDGFIAHVCEGQRVRVGDRLLSFDLDHLAQRAKSLVTPVILTNGERFEIVRRIEGRRIEVGEALMELRLRAASEAGAAGGGEARREIVLQFEHGLHARPAATIARAAQRFAAEIAVFANDKRANAKSAVSLMTLGARKGDVLAIEAVGADAAAAARAVAEAAAQREARVTPAPALAPIAPEQPPKADELRGLCASPGLAVGVIVKIVRSEASVAEKGRGLEFERAALARARDRAKNKIEQAAQSGQASQRAVLTAHAALIDDAELASAADRLIADGKSAAFAWRAAIATQIETFSKLGDGYMAERTADLKDVEMQVLTALGVASHSDLSKLPERAIVTADELLPSEFAALDKTRLAGLCMAGGGPTSHVALLAQAAGVPALAAAGARVMEVVEGATVILDAEAGALQLAPSAKELREAQALILTQRARAAAAQGGAGDEARTSDGTRILVLANLAAANEATGAIERGAEGCGLLRTEFLFLDRDTPPSEQEQHAQYQAIADALAGRPLVVRTLDAGGDKPMPYLALADEENPALGLRGVRASLKYPELLRAQLRAILRVRPLPKILLPMVTDIAELRRVRAMLAELDSGHEIELGVMVETPAAAMLADQLAAEAQFLSIGTNDLAQYVLAMDRCNAELAGLIDPLHPAVLRLIAHAAEAARKHGRSISVCGAAASDPLAAPLLVGLGIDTLSAAPSAIPAVKARLREIRHADCRRAGEGALALGDAQAVRRLAASLGRAP